MNIVQLLTYQVTSGASYSKAAATSTIDNNTAIYRVIIFGAEKRGSKVNHGK
jgi:hypothetical protein